MLLFPRIADDLLMVVVLALTVTIARSVSYRQEVVDYHMYWDHDIIKQPAVVSCVSYMYKCLWGGTKMCDCKILTPNLTNDIHQITKFYMARPFFFAFGVLHSKGKRNDYTR